MKFYGAAICSQCVNAKKFLDKNSMEYTYVDITKNTATMREFLSLRDSREEFNEIKELGFIGIPAFLYEDGRIEFSMEGLDLDLNPDLDDETPGLCGLDGC